MITTVLLVFSRLPIYTEAANMAGTAGVFVFLFLLGGFSSTSGANGEKKHLKVTSILSEPFLTERVGDNLQGNDRYEGYIKDLLNAVAYRLGVNYTIQIVADGRYGSPSSDGSAWNGMVGELVRGEVDIAAADMTENYIREQVVDFTTPYMSLGITLLMNKKDVTSSVEQMESGDIFFLQPFAYSVWICLVVATIVISVLFYLITRFHPGEQQNGGPSAEGSGNLGILGSLWFVYGGLTLQGYTRRPRSSAAFVLSAFWWSFSIIFLATYVMGMVSTQARSMFSVPGLKIRALDDVIKQNDIEIGCISGGSTMTFFKHSRVPIYGKTWAKMLYTDQGSSAFVKSTKEGIDRVKAGKYAYIGESPMIDYILRHSCDLVQVGGLLDTKSYALAVQEGSPLREKLSTAILELKEVGSLHKFYSNWWWRGDLDCRDGSAVMPDMFHPSDSPQFKAKESIGLTTAGCTFIYLFVGICIAAIVLLFEVLFYKVRGGGKTAGTSDKQQSDANSA